MSTRSPLRIFAASMLSLLLAIVLGNPVAAAQGRHSYPDRIELPDAFLPEGIAIGPGPTAWFGSRADGDIYQVNLRTGRGRTISEGPGTPSVGLKSDHRHRLFVAGGPSGSGRVIDTRSGKVLADYQFTTGPSFVNDVILTKSFAWFTDSQQAQLYGVPLGRRGALPAATEIVTLPLTGDWVQDPASFNANGIALTPDRRALLVIQSGSGLLFKVNPQTGVATEVDLGGTLLVNGDGLLVIGRTLYVVQNRLNKVAVVQLNRAGTQGTLVEELTDPGFDVPTTIAAFGRSLYLPNARFTTPPAPDTEYWVTRINR